MTKESFFNIEFETPPPELELSVEMRCREVMNSNDFDNYHCTCRLPSMMQIILTLSTISSKPLVSSAVRNFTKGTKRDIIFLH